jgi:hypothetical protein
VPYFVCVLARIAFALLTLLALGAVVSPAQGADSERERATAGSWLATAELTLQSWLAGSVTTSFATATLRTASSRIAAIEHAARQKSEAGQSDEDIIAVAAAAIGANDASGARNALAQIDARLMRAQSLRP